MTREGCTIKSTFTVCKYLKHFTVLQEPRQAIAGSEGTLSVTPGYVLEISANVPTPVDIIDFSVTIKAANYIYITFFNDNNIVESKTVSSYCSSILMKH